MELSLLEWKFCLHHQPWQPLLHWLASEPSGSGSHFFLLPSASWGGEAITVRQVLRYSWRGWTGPCPGLCAVSQPNSRSHAPAPHGMGLTPPHLLLTEMILSAHTFLPGWGRCGRKKEKSMKQAPPERSGFTISPHWEVGIRT